MMKYALRNRMIEWMHVSEKSYSDPFNEIELDVVFIDPDGEEKIAPAFWSGGNEWRVRFASDKTGVHHYRTICSDKGNVDLHDQTGEITVSHRKTKNPLYSHGFLRISDDKRHFEHKDGTPFFWLGDTWWMGLCARLQWPEDFQKLMFDRIEKGFSVIQIVAGLYPDMPGFDERGANEAGFPWEAEYSRINPSYFDMMDIRIACLVENGLLPCIVGCWGYYIQSLGIDKIKKHWRYLIARYGAYPVIWCLAGEGIMPFYLSENKEKDKLDQKKGWTEIARYVRSINAFGHPMTIHPTRYGREQIEEPELIDFEMLQTGHAGHLSVPDTVESMRTALKRTPKMPVLNAEVNYEGILEANREEIQRLVFWASILTGAAGHTYGANGVWQVNTKEKPYGPSPTGTSWGDTPWEVAAQYPGSRHLGVAKRILERFQWWKIESHQEWVGTHQGYEDKYFVPYAGGIPGKLRIIYFSPFLPLSRVKNLEKDTTYHATCFNPSDGSKHDLGKVSPNESREWKPPKPPIQRDWILILTAIKSNST